MHSEVIPLWTRFVTGVTGIRTGRRVVTWDDPSREDMDWLHNGPTEARSRPSEQTFSWTFSWTSVLFGRRRSPDAGVRLRGASVSTTGCHQDRRHPYANAFGDVQVSAVPV